MKGALVAFSEGGNLCPLWWRFSNQLDIVSETLNSCHAIDLELWLAILHSLVCPEADWQNRVGKRG